MSAAPAPAPKPQKVSDFLGAQENKGDFELTNADDIALASTLSPDEKANFVKAVRDIVELNGTGDIPGIQASYIAVSEYVQDFTLVKASDAMKKALFLAHNWAALGKGTGGLAGAAVRWALHKHFSTAREFRIHDKVPAGSIALIQEYDRVAMNNKDLVNFFITNAVSVAALSGAMVNRIVHHWDAKHPGPQKAFISAMGMADSLTDDQYRPVFYLAVHPLPLSFTEKLRADSAKGVLPDVAEVVRLRCDGPPAGYGALNACAAAISSFLLEPLMNESKLSEIDIPEMPANPDLDTLVFYKKELARVQAHNEKADRLRNSIPNLKREILDVQGVNNAIIKEAGHYHQFATKYGYAERRTVDMKLYEKPMIILAAYIFAKVKGSLAGSAALRKFRDQHAREINKRVTAFAEMDEGEDIYSALGI